MAAPGGPSHSDARGSGHPNPFLASVPRSDTKRSNVRGSSQLEEMHSFRNEYLAVLRKKIAHFNSVSIVFCALEMMFGIHSSRPNRCITK